MAGLRFAMRGRWHRVVTGRMVVVALLVGVVLAVGSVPVAAVLVDLHPVAAPERKFALHRVQDGHFIVTLYDEGPTGTIWYTAAEPEPAQSLRRFAELSSTMASENDPRPKIIRIEARDLWTSATLYRVGWPLVSTYSVSRTSRNMHVTADAGVVFVRSLGGSWAIPYLPLWTGLLANTLFYAAIALTPMVLLRWRRTRRRRARGLCAACGYELGEGVGVCPECGLESRQSSRAPRVSEGA